MMAAVTAVVLAAAMAMTGCDDNGDDVDNGSDSSGGNGGNDDDRNDDGNGIYHVYLHLKKWMSILNTILDQYKASLKTCLDFLQLVFSALTMTERPLHNFEVFQSFE